MMERMVGKIFGWLLLLPLLSGCGVDRVAAVDGGTQAAASTVTATDRRVTITAPTGVERYPVLAEAIERVIAQHRHSFQEMVAEAAADGDPADTWELTIDYRGLVGNRYLRVVEGDGYVYIGGAHGMPIIERYTYDGHGKRIMAIDDWFEGDAVWSVISDHARRSLPGLVGDYAVPEMIESGTAADPASFALYEPVFSADGPVMAFRIIFPPYRVAPYVAGPQSVDVPLSELAPYLTGHARTVLLAEAGSD